MFEIEKTSGLNSDKLVAGNGYDYITRTSQSQGVLSSTGFINESNLNPPGNWSLGLLQMDFFYRRKPWYAGQFVRKITPKVNLSDSAVLFLSTILNLQKKKLLSVLVRDVDMVFKNTIVRLPITPDNEINFAFMESFIQELEAERIQELEAYLKASGLDSYELTEEEREILGSFSNIPLKAYPLKSIFNKIKQGRRLKKDDQLPGNIPFVMSGVTNAGVVNYVSNPIASFPKNSITVDIFGNTFYRNYNFGAGDDTGVYWNDEKHYSENMMLYFASSIYRSLAGKFNYGNKLRSSESYNIEIFLPSSNDNEPDLKTTEVFISAIKKLVIKDVVEFAKAKTEATKAVVNRDS